MDGNLITEMFVIVMIHGKEFEEKAKAFGFCLLVIIPNIVYNQVRSASFTPLGEGSRPAACTTRGLGGNNQVQQKKQDPTKSLTFFLSIIPNIPSSIILNRYVRPYGGQ